MQARLHIDGLAYGGEGVASLPSGKRIFVPGAAPGDEALVEVVEERPKSARGRLVTLLAPGPDRRPPPCPHAGTCGGCQLQHLGDGAQGRAREAAFYDALGRLAGVPREAIADPRPLEPSPAQLRYRTRCRLHLERGAVGYRARRSSALVPVESCLLLAPALEALALAVAAALRERPVPGAEDLDATVGADGRGAIRLALRAPPSAAARARAEELCRTVPGLAGVVLTAPGAPPLVIGDPVVASPAPAAPGATLLGRPDAFAQANRAANERLVALALEALAPAPEDEAIELYAGAGNFTLGLARACRRVLAVEEASVSLELGRRAAAAAGLGDRIRFVAGDAVAVCRGLLAEGRRFDLALFDPPRAGARELPAALAALGPRRIACVGCDPSTLARDVKALVALGYDPVRAVPVDMFPQTYHLEGLVLLARR